MLTKRTPFYYLLLSCLTCIGLTAFVYRSASSQSEVTPAAIVENNTSGICLVDEPRLNGYQYIKPLLSAEPECESEKLMPLKAAISDQIMSLQSAGTITSASVYLKDFDQSDWISINEEEKFIPGSLMKVPTMMAYLKMRETNPDILKKSTLFQFPYKEKMITFPSRMLQVGNSYTVAELLHYMIAYSDNSATAMLVNGMDKKVFHKIFSDLDLPAIDIHSPNNLLTARNISTFLNTLYNASYLTINNSELAVELLSECDFKEGFVSGLPADVKIAHKFGETGDGVTAQLHETAIIYIGQSAYLLTVMTKGKDLKSMTPALSSISKLVYDRMSQIKKAS